jgi:23S rRNA pseudouridine1911/1915/1917 synthase
VRELVPAALDGERIDRAVATLTGLSRHVVADLVAAGEVRVGGRPVTTRSRKVAQGELLELEVPEAVVVGPVVGDPDVPFTVVFADEDVVVVDKPPGVVVHPGSGRSGGTLVNGLVGRFPDILGVGDPTRPGIVHRLDAGTSGLLVVARTEVSYESLVEQLAARTVERVYLALTWGAFDAPAGVVDAPVGRAERHRTRMAVSSRGRAARTRYDVIASFREPESLSLVECRLETGRTHQIRVHLAAIAHPVVGDPTYGGGRQRLGLSRPFLHARGLAFDHPTTGARCRFDSPLPADLEELHARLS